MSSVSRCNSCAAPMCKWLLKMKVSEGMEVTKEDRVNYSHKGGVDTVYIVKKCLKYQKSEMEEEE